MSPDDVADVEVLESEEFEEAEQDIPHCAGSAPPDPAAYVLALQLTEIGVTLRQVLLPGLASTPQLLPWQVLELRRWAKSLRREVLPLGLFNTRAVDSTKVPLARLGHLSNQAWHFVEDCVGDLRRTIEEANVCWIGKRGWCAKQAQAAAAAIDLQDLEGMEAWTLSRFGVGLDGLCRAVAARGSLLGPSGGKLLQRARRALRAWLETRAEAGNKDLVWSTPESLEEAVREVFARLPSVELKESARRRLCVLAVASHGAVRADLARQRSGARGERLLEERLHAAGVERNEYYTEDDLREKQVSLFGRPVYATPDIVFRQPVVINRDTVVRWIDSKGSCPLPDFAFASVVTKLRGQLSRFVELFGPGLVVWRGGFSDAATAGIAGVRVATWPMSESTAASWVHWQ